MVDRKTNISKLFNDTKGLSTIVSSSYGYTIKMFVSDINDLYETSITLRQAREYFRNNGIVCGRLKITTLSDYLKYLQKLNRLAEETKERPTPGTQKYRRFGNPRKSKGQGRTVNYGKTGGAV